MSLQAIENFVIIGVGADEEPDDGITAPAANGAVVGGDSDGPYVGMGREFFEAEAGMGGVGEEGAKGGFGLFFDGGREFGEVAAEVGGDVGNHNLSGSSGCVCPASYSADALSASLASFSGDL